MADGRNFLLTSEEKYDVIIGELYNAANAGIANLYTREYYELCKKHLANQSLMCQWVALKDLPEGALKGVLYTFQSVFPHTTLWFAMPDIIAIVGSKKGLKLNLTSLEHRLQTPRLKDELKRIGLDSPFVLLSHFLMNEKASLNYVQDAKMITDNHPYIEFSIPRSLHYMYFKKEIARTLQHINNLRTPIVSPKKKGLSQIEKIFMRSFKAKDHVFKAYAFQVQGFTSKVIGEYKKALETSPWDRDASVMLRHILGAKRINPYRDL